MKLKFIVCALVVISFSPSVFSQAARLPAGAKPLTGQDQAIEGPEQLPYPQQNLPPQGVPGQPLYQSDQVINQPLPQGDYKSDLPSGWDTPPQVQPGEIPLQDLTGKPWKPVPAGQGNPGDNVIVEEEIPIYKRPANPTEQAPIIEEETIDGQQTQKRAPRRWGQ